MTLQLAFPLDFIWDGDFKHNNIQYQYPTLQSIFLAKSSSHGNNQMIKKIKKIESIIAKNHKKKKKKEKEKRKKQYLSFLQNTSVLTSSESTIVFCTTFLIFSSNHYLAMYKTIYVY